MSLISRMMHSQKKILTLWANRKSLAFWRSEDLHSIGWGRIVFLCWKCNPCADRLRESVAVLEWFEVKAESRRHCWTVRKIRTVQHDCSRWENEIDWCSKNQAISSYHAVCFLAKSWGHTSIDCPNWPRTHREKHWSRTGHRLWLGNLFQKGYDSNWGCQRLFPIHIRNELTDEGQKRRVGKRQEYAMLVVASM